MSTANKTLVSKYFEEIFNKKNLAACDELVATDFVENAPPPFAAGAPGRVHGPTSTRETAVFLLTVFPDLRMTVEALIAEGDIVAARVLAAGTSVATEAAPAGVRFSAGQSHWFRVQGRQLAEHWATRDDLSVIVPFVGAYAAGAPAKRAARKPAKKPASKPAKKPASKPAKKPAKKPAAAAKPARRRA